MPLKESEAIVLRTFPLGEGDRLVSFLDRQSGRMRGVARGARLPKSRFGSTLEMLAYIRIWYFERETRELVRINQCELIESFMDVQQRLSVRRRPRPGQRNYRLGSGREGSGGRAVPPDPVNGPRDSHARAISSSTCIFLLVDGAAWRLARTARPMFTLWSKLLNLETAFHSSGFAELYCADCRDDWMKPISKEALSIGRRRLSGTLDRLLKENPPIESAKEILSYALDILEHHIEKKLISRKTFETGESGIVEI